MDDIHPNLCEILRPTDGAAENNFFGRQGAFLLTIMSHNEQLFILHGQSSQFAVVPSFVNHRTTEQPILFGHPYHEFPLEALASLVMKPC
jgi:hypothetical protein